jgi:hypothetical protein
MDHTTIKVFQSHHDVAERRHRLSFTQPAAARKVISQRHLSAWHDEHVVIAVLAAVHYRHDVPRSF